MKYVIIFLLLTFYTYSFAQVTDSTKFITSINFNFNNRLSYSDNKLYKIFGFKLGFSMLRKHKVGIGFNYLYSDIYDIKTIKIDNISYDIKSPLTYYFITAFYEPILYQNKHWEFSIPFQIGIGESFFSYSINNKRNIYNKSNIINIESVLSGHYKIFWWLGIGSGVGYNYNLKTTSSIDKNFNGIVFYAKIKIFVGDIYKHYIKTKKT